MAFEISKILNGKTSLIEVAGLTQLVNQYYMSIFGPYAATENFALQQMKKVLNYEKHAFLAFETRRDKKNGTIVPPTFYPYGYVLFSMNARKNDKLNTHIEEIFSRNDSAGGIKVHLLYSVAQEIKNFSKALKRDTIPKFFYMKIPISANDEIEFYKNIGFEVCKKLPIEIILRGRLR